VIGVRTSVATSSEGTHGAVGITGVKREMTGLDPGWREIAVQRSSHRSKGGGAVLGPGL
jgi:hypothetical protein